MNDEEKAAARIELFMFAKNSFDDILNKAEELGLIDEFMMIASAGLVVDQVDGNSIVESVSNINVDTKEEMISLVTYLMGSYSEDDEADDTTNIDYWLNLN
jgi:choline kinase